MHTDIMSVSVVVPTYYRSQDLTALLNSILEQMVKPIEVIIVDDTPTAVIRHFCDDYEIAFNKAKTALLYIRNPKKRSTAIARNVGATIARGDILLFLDSDIILYHDYVQKILKTFEEYPRALGVAGWIVPLYPTNKNMRYYFFHVLRKLFFLFRDSKDSCRFLEYPTALTKMVECQWFSGSNMAWKRNVFNKFRFDENLRGYAFMEDVLFSGSVRKEYPDKLLMTPDAKCIHSVSKEARMEKSKLRILKLQNRKYVQTRLFGAKGLLMFGWQNLGLLIIRLIAKVRKNSNITDQFL